MEGLLGITGITLLLGVLVGLVAYVLYGGSSS